MNQNQTEQLKRDLTLMLIALTGWEEEIRGTDGRHRTRAWKGYNFDVLGDLQSDGLIYQIPGGKSLILKDRGVEMATELIRGTVVRKVKSPAAGCGRRLSRKEV